MRAIIITSLTDRQFVYVFIIDRQSVNVKYNVNSQPSVFVYLVKTI